jgi:phosphopantothenoylcysteine decarboxylase / phosphopantothenate---cysteine ligase
MPRIVITSGPTREPLDPVRFISNRSSGRMGAALAAACLERNCSVVVVSGPVAIEYPRGAQILYVETTAEMLSQTRIQFESADGLIGAAAPCDFRSQFVSAKKLAKSNYGMNLPLVPTDDILQTLAAHKANRWILGFALETDDHERHALEKLRKKGCDWIVLNDAKVLDAENTSISLYDQAEQVCLAASGTKSEVAKKIVNYVLSQPG